ncbi:hypothetical protein FIBSPDRAFT_798033 [Athelia psychrophila]|uniref:Smr domain-containing protein n=1 Tax=Athelia psychrophila TaxID=1759441 RepID=A0A166C1Y2_9AGAM|nr:hypothetical protein FIBSPDRAFT_798033 [Fibularhizoctonia sp. CBS 109695]
MGAQSTLYESLQAEFCPPLDTSLLAALLADLQLDSHGEPISPSSTEIRSLRKTLRQLAAQATEQVEQELSDELASVHIQQHSATDSTPEFYYGDTTTSDSGSSLQSFSSPLGFLQAALPDIPTLRLEEALNKAGGDGDDVDMESVIDALLTSEYVRELEERGTDGLDGELSSSISWETVQAPKKKVSKRKAARGQTISIVDIRQKQHTPRTNSLSVPDPWTQLTSLSSHVASFLPPLEPSFFLSYFHNPDYTSPSAALRGALNAVIDTNPKSAESDTSVLFSVLDILRSNPQYYTLPPYAQHQLVSDAQLTLAATVGRGEDALDLVWLLNELDDDGVTNLERGVYHVTPKSPTSATWSTSPTWSAPPSPMIVMSDDGPSSPISPTSPAILKPKSKKAKSIATTSQWQDVPVRKPPKSYPHSSFIPARPSAPAWRPQVGGNALGQGGKGDVGELAQQARERNAFLRQAADAWKKGGKKNHGGEVAAYYADQAREIQETLKKGQLERARAMVEAKRTWTPTGDTVDLHGTNVAEAVAIVKEILQRDGCTPSKTLTIITGRGLHSTNRVGVLKPAVRSALVADGWHVATWEGGLIVKGKTGMYAR